MNYYAITQKKDSGCPVGYLDITLYDHLPGKNEKIDYGIVYPWYSNPKGLSELPDGGCLVSREQPFQFSIRPFAYMLQIMDQAFLDTLQEFKAPIKSVKPVRIFSSKSGLEITTKQYYISIFSDEFYVNMKRVLNESESLIENEGSIDFWPEKISIKEDCSLPAFAIENIDFADQTIICSQGFVDSAKSRNVKGIDFVRIEFAKWANPNLLTYSEDHILPVL
ncbi:Imm43 family immunity protein [Achromobacter sp. NCFB-sbj8-Ac1-l]|uniref:Imm43 family immunity protein n=1 Tax=unclassified Achromobacter TaxID=2626865 RepID=UPI004046A6E1